MQGKAIALRLALDGVEVIVRGRDAARGARRSAAARGDRRVILEEACGRVSNFKSNERTASDD
jgi:predicted dinucleotide-binding enzyme